MSVPARSTELRRDADGVVRHGSEWLQLWADPDSLRSAEARARDIDLSRTVADHERAIAAALRAVARDPQVQVSFAPAAPGFANRQAILPPLGRPPQRETIAVARGTADGIAAVLRHHDAALHACLAPMDPTHRALLTALEHARCEAMAARQMPGLLHNLAASTAWHLERLGFAHARLPADIPLDEAMHVVMRGRFTEGPVELPSLGLRLWDRWVRLHLAAETTSLAACLCSQADFAAAAAIFAAALLRSIGRVEAVDPPRPRSPDRGEDAATHAPRVIQAPEPQADADSPAPTSLAAPAAAHRTAAFTTAHDRVIRPADICDPADLARLRALLDAEAGMARSLLSRLANRLQRRLLARQRRAWDFDLDDGTLDAARLDRVVVTPSASLAFKQERDSAFRDTVVGLLIDCSGSMRGRPILLATIAADITAQALERCGVACEVLGFTTADFAGGRSAADWARAGRPANPGRLGDLRHIAVKTADTSYRSSRAGFGALLRPDLLRENVDGEALAWAHHRLLARRERRRVLVVISDGAPAETATARANPPGLLERQLAETVAWITKLGRVELRAIGIRHDVSRHYRASVTIPDARMVGPALVAQLGAVFDATEARRGR